ncbi:hypothetical protein EV44_g0426 [Erysiphe necator]|uniref:Csep0475 effector protein n=1 Tax=Uncinula necator TaxID=52586 RepID=A0A0B1PG81_UNCNE|nr:hypothetical protein EV44_g0426 [Erysiphe necator]
MYFARISIAILICGAMALPTQLKNSDLSLEAANGNAEKRDFNSTTELISKVKEHSVATNPSANQTDTITSDSTTTMVGEINRESKLASRAIKLTKNLFNMRSLPEKSPPYSTFSITKVMKRVRFTRKRANGQNHISNNQHVQRIPKRRNMGWILQHM